MNWNNLKLNKCPQCNKDFMHGLDLSIRGMMKHSCGFMIRESRYTQIVSNQINRDLEKQREDMEKEVDDFFNIDPNYPK